MPNPTSGQADQKTLFFISNSHLDTQWNWDVKTTINEYVRNTMEQNFTRLDKYPNLTFNFEGAIRYMWMKEYYPEQYAKLKTYVQNGRWHISGCAVDANDVMVSSAESIMRNWLYANQFFKKEFGVRGGYDVMLPDCFGFSYALPSLARHCGFKGFHTAKLAWGSAEYDQLPPFGIWQGVDGSQIYAVYKPGAYDNHEQYNKNMANDSEMAAITADNYNKYGVAAEIRYVGPRSDRGGALQDNASSSGENTPYWLNLSAQTNGAVKVRIATPDEIFDYLDQNKNQKYHVKDGELPMRTHGVGSYTSRTMLKLWNRRNELLADATEKSASLAQWLGVQTYPQTAINDAWVRNLWQAHHDGITGTSIPNAYLYSMNDYVLVNKTLANLLKTTTGNIVRAMDTQTEGMPVVVYNPLSFQRTDIVEARLTMPAQPEGLRVFDKDGKEVLSQISSYDDTTGEVVFLFAATVPSLGYAVYDVRFGEASQLTSSLQMNRRSRQLSNGNYRLTLSETGDPSQLIDLANNRQVLSASQLQMIYDHEDTWPSWEISYTDILRTPTAVDENVSITKAEDGPLRKSFRVVKEKDGSQFVQYIRMNALDNRIDIVSEVDWQSHERMLKANFQMAFNNPKATYDISLGTIERGNRTADCYEVQGHQWADMSTIDGSYGLSILNDCKYGWDKPTASSLRLTLIHTPSTGNSYTYQADQDLGVNLFTYSLFPHQGKWSELTQKAASQLNQPLVAVTAPKHEGALGKEVEFLSVSTDQVAVKAVKKAEETNELIVRVYEWAGQQHDQVTLTFPARVLSAREVNGLEEQVGSVTTSDNTLTFSISKYQPKTFAVTLAAAMTPTDEQTDVAVSLPYNVDMMSYDSKKNDALKSAPYAYPAELVPDVVTADGISFVMGNRSDGQKNAVRCSGQTIDLPAAGRKLYLLAASTEATGTVGEFVVGDQTYQFEVPYYGGTLGQLDSPYNGGTHYRKQDVALTTTHSHHISGNSDEQYRFLYMYRFAMTLPEGASQLILPSNSSLMVYAATVSDTQADDIQPLTTLQTYIDYQELGSLSDDACGEWITPSTIVASHQINDNESAKMAADRDELTKWCVTASQSQTPYLEYRFSEPREICQWMLLNAGSESDNYVTRACKLQRYDNGKWIDVDEISGNRDNKIVRGVTPFTTDRVRLQMIQGEQSGYTTRIYEFGVYGKPRTVTAIQQPTTVAPTSAIRLLGSSPNPCQGSTQIRCQVPAGIQQVALNILSYDGRIVCREDYQVSEGNQTLLWSGHLPNGIYLYRLSTADNRHSNTQRIIFHK
ncbi:MAG: discoidin domain-containing protein [Prevotella sp.]|nr:discoidin domain-containing protein [Prevotella sp.]